MDYKNVSQNSSIFDFTTNYTMLLDNLNMEEQIGHQIKALLDIYMNNDTVLGDPANIIVISLYCLLVTAASEYV